jgi:type VI protein secretion system component VasK
VLIALADPQRNAALGWMVLGIAVLVFVASAFGHASQVTEMNQGFFDDEDVYIWNILISVMVFVWLVCAAAAIQRIVRKRLPVPTGQRPSPAEEGER